MVAVASLFFVGCTPRQVVKRPPTRRVPPPTRTVPKPTPTPKDTVIAVIDLDTATDVHVIKEEDHPSMYRVALCLPLGVSQLRRDSMSGGSTRMLHFYAGMKIGLQSIDIPDCEIDVIDTEEFGLDWQAKVAERGRYNLFFGGRSKEDVAYLSAQASEQETYYLSPWSLRDPAQTPHPYHLQMKPGFHAHIMQILEHIEGQGRMEDVVLLGTAREQGRIDEINRLYADWTGRTDLLERYIIEDLDEMDDLEIEEWVEDEERQFVFVLPISNRHHDVQAFIRVLEANELHDRSVIYGLTDWDASFLISQLQNLDIRLANWEVSRRYLDDLAFAERYHSLMREQPDDWAYDGFMYADLLGDFIRQDIQGVPPTQMRLETPDRSIEFMDHDAIKYPRGEIGTLKSYLENRNVQLLEVDDYLYQPWRP